MIKEAHVSFEIAELLKEKGFDIPCYDFYQLEDDEAIKKHSQRSLPLDWNADNDYVWSRPSHQLVLAWLREKGLSLEISATASGWMWGLCKTNGTGICWSSDTDAGPNDGGCWDDYDECVEAGLLYVLQGIVMKQEDKELLMRDLCARLPYEV